MERGCNGNGGGGGVKVTFIETQFVTSDAAGFKSLVQRLTGNDAGVAPAPPLQRPLPCRADGWRPAGGASASATVGVGIRREAVPPAAPWVDEMMLYETCDLAEMLLCVDVGASGGRCHGGGGGGYGGFPC